MQQSVQLSDINTLIKSSYISSQQSADEDEEWENVSYTDLNLDGMNDPFANKFKNVTKEYKKLSNYSIKYESW